jgi:hypothetical protein
MRITQDIRSAMRQKSTESVRAGSNVYVTDDRPVRTSGTR